MAGPSQRQNVGRRRRPLAAAVVGSLLLCLWLAPGALATNKVYWGNDDNATISFANLDNTGGGAQLNTTGATPGNPEGVALDPATNKIYWANLSGTISFANLDDTGGGGQLNTTGATPAGPSGVAINPATNKIYWANESNNTISFANLDNTGGGGQLNTGAATLNFPEGVAVNPATNKIYWANVGNSTISFTNLDNTGGGGQLNTTGATLNGPVGVAIDPAANKIYTANDGNSTISFANLDNTGGGGQLNTTGATLNGPFGVAIDPAANKIYTANDGNSTISFANLDNTGGGGQLNTSGATLDAPEFPALLKAPAGTGVPSVSAQASTLACSQGAWAADQLGGFLYQAPQSFAYSWSRNGQSIAGATTSSLKPAGGGSFTCQVSAQNQAGSTSQASAAVSICVVPKLRGKSLKRARKALRRNDCKPKVKGPRSGRVKKQRPKPGTVLRAGSKVKLKLG